MKNKDIKDILFAVALFSALTVTLSGCGGVVKPTSTAAAPVDTDGDGVGDNADAFPNDATETTDSDSDSVGNNADAFPNDATETADADNDGVGNNADAFPNDVTETADADNDGVGDNADAFPNDATETADTDGDNADDFPSDSARSVATLQLPGQDSLTGRDTVTATESKIETVAAKAPKEGSVTQSSAGKVSVSVVHDAAGSEFTVTNDDGWSVADTDKEGRLNDAPTGWEGLP